MYEYSWCNTELYNSSLNPLIIIHSGLINFVLKTKKTYVLQPSSIKRKVRIINLRVNDW